MARFKHIDTGPRPGESLTNKLVATTCADWSSAQGYHRWMREASGCGLYSGPSVEMNSLNKTGYGNAVWPCWSRLEQSPALPGLKIITQVLMGEVLGAF